MYLFEKQICLNQVVLGKNKSEFTPEEVRRQILVLNYNIFYSRSTLNGIGSSIIHCMVC